MIKNLIKTAVRHILKHKGYSLLNILGLVLGITSSLFLILYVADELSYDRYHENAERIYRVSSKITETDDQFTWIVAQIPFGPQVAADYPEIESFVRFIPMPRSLFKYEDKEYNEENFFYVDSTLFDIFTYKVLRGEVKTALVEPNKIILTETAAAKYFGDDDPVGKTLVTGDRTFEVTGIIEDVPSNSHFRFDAIAARNNLPKELGTWGNFGVFTYLLLPEDIDVKAFEAKIQEMYPRYMEQIFKPVNINIEYILEPVTRIHLFSTSSGEPEPTGSITYVYFFAVVALFLVLIAAMNYMNLATARSSGRAREVGMRKVVGSQRSVLVMQFLSESTVFTVISLVISILLLAVLLPQLNLLAGKSFDLHVLYSPVFLLSLLGIVVMVGIFGGSYPAFFLSRFSPVTVMKGEITTGSAGSLFRKILVVIQFVISVGMIICTLVVFSQLNYMRNMDQGFDQKNVISIRLNGRMVFKYTTLKSMLLENPDIKFVGGTNTTVGDGSGKVLFNIEMEDQGMQSRGINFAVVDHDFIEALGIRMKEGRDFQLDMPSDSLTGVVVNETFVKRMGWKEAIGKRVELGDGQQIKARVIGVMYDYHQTGMYNEIETFMLVYRLRNPILYIKLADNDTRETIGFIETKWKEVFPDQPFVYEFLTDTFNNQFEADEKRGLIFTLFTMLAILIACLGLFGLASYNVEQRTKEIGIRKVFGAGEGVILRLIVKDFLYLTGIAIVIAVPLAYYLMNQWLEKYVYRITPGVLLFLASALATLLITFVTVSYKAYQAAILNPAESIKTE